MKRFLDSTTKSTNLKNKLQEWTCPSCTKLFNSDNDSMNSHITYCLLQMEKWNNPDGESIEEKDKKKLKSNQIEQVIDDTKISAIKDLSGLFLIYDFISEEEEELLLKSIENDTQQWRKYLFNGEHLVKQWGYITQHAIPGEKSGFVRKNIIEKGEPDLPVYFTILVERVMKLLKHNKNLPIETRRELDDFIITECNCNCYIKNENHHVNYHFDDRGLSGKALINLSLNSAGSMRYKNNDNGNDIIVELPRRTLQIVTGEARWNFKHAIFASDIADEKRISLTFRSPFLRLKNDECNDNKKITQWFTK